MLLLIAISTGCNKSGEVKKENARERTKSTGVLLWGADVVGGIPYVYEDPNNKGNYIGFEMDIVKSIASHMGVKQQMVIKAWDTLIPELQKGSFDMAINGIENTEDRRKLVLFSAPYYVYSQQITVRKETKGISRIEDLKGKKVATLSGTAAEDILRSAGNITVQTNPEIIYSYKDLSDRKVDAVLLDKPIAVAYGGAIPKLKNVGESFGEGEYGIAFRKEDTSLKNAVNKALEEMKNSGELKTILERWSIFDAHQHRIGLK